MPQPIRMGGRRVLSSSLHTLSRWVGRHTLSSALWCASLHSYPALTHYEMGGESSQFTPTPSIPDPSRWVGGASSRPHSTPYPDGWGDTQTTNHGDGVYLSSPYPAGGDSMSCHVSNPHLLQVGEDWSLVFTTPPPHGLLPTILSTFSQPFPILNVIPLPVNVTLQVAGGDTDVWFQV